MLLEDNLPGLPVGLHHIAQLPRDLVVGVHSLGGEHALDGKTHSQGGLLTGAFPAGCGLGHSGGHEFPHSKLATGLVCSADQGVLGVRLAATPAPRACSGFRQ